MTEPPPVHPGWCQGTHGGQFHESPRSEVTGRNGACLNVQVNDYGTGPFVVLARQQAEGEFLAAYDAALAAELEAGMSATSQLSLRDWAELMDLDVTTYTAGKVPRSVPFLCLSDAAGQAEGSGQPVLRWDGHQGHEVPEDELDAVLEPEAS